MKPVRDWDEEYVLSLPLDETDQFEAKGRKGLDLTVSNVNEQIVRQTLSKAISAFANSGGGVLVYGLKDPKKSGGEWLVDDGGIDSSIKGNTREWLEDVIPHLVDLPLSTFNVYAILPKGPTSQIHPGRALYVIDIPDSPLAPHQAHDKRYYIRTGGKSQPIVHRLVADIMGRRQYPQIELEFAVKSIRRLWSRKVELVVKAKNIGRVYAQHVSCIVYLPPSLAAHRRPLFNSETNWCILV